MWITLSVVLAVVSMLVIGVLVMYHTRGFWGLESNSNAATLNASLNFASATSLYPLVVVVVVVVSVLLLLSCATKGFG